MGRRKGEGMSRRAHSRSAGAILVVEDDEAIAASLEMILGGEGYEVTRCADGKMALELAISESYDLVLTDFRLPGMGGLDLLGALREAKPLRPVILMTAHGNTELAIEATKRGAYDYLLKPFDLEEMLEAVAQATRAGRAMGRRVTLGEEAPVRGDASLLGRSRAMQRVYKEIGRVAPTDVSVLILGETGTGKELVARAIYQHSSRNKAPFVAVNCGAIPENLLESELFGHVRGAFTGATADRVGRFEQANGGTLLLDEIGDLPLPVQVKLLRVLQERRVMPLGSNREIPVDVRIIAATHQPLQSLIDRQAFREDLYFRLNSAVIALPPLRERGEEDFSLLVAHFLSEARAEYGMEGARFSDKARRRLGDHGWPGNVRELRNTIRQLVLNSRGFEVSPEQVEAVLRGGESVIAGLSMGGSGDFAKAVAEPVRNALALAKAEGKGAVHGDLVASLERQIIQIALSMADDHLGRVSVWLGISRVTLRKKMAQFNLGKHPNSRRDGSAR